MVHKRVRIQGEGKKLQRRSRTVYALLFCAGLAVMSAAGCGSTQYTSANGKTADSEEGDDPGMDSEQDDPIKTEMEAFRDERQEEEEDSDEEDEEEEELPGSEAGFEDTRLAQLGEIIGLNQYSLAEEIPERERREDYIMLLCESGEEYTVKPGDYLWGISRRFLGRGSDYRGIQQANWEVLDGKTLLLPGMKLVIPDRAYIKRQKGSLGGYINYGAYSMDYPINMKYGYMKDDACLSSFSSDSADAGILFHVTENRLGHNGFTEDWEEVQEKIRASGEAVLGEELKNLTFDKFTLGNGDDLYEFSYTCMDNGELRDYMVCYRLAPRYMAEFIGSAPHKRLADVGVQIEDLTRYIAADFTDMGGDSNTASLKYKRYKGADQWPWEDLHNPFARVVNDTSRAVETMDVQNYEITWQEPQLEELFRMLVVWHEDMDDEEIERFKESKVKASQLSWITSLELKEWVLDERDTIRFNDRYTVSRKIEPFERSDLQDLRHLRNLESISLEVGSISDYSVLGELPRLTSIEISAGRTVKDVDFLAKLPGLKSLELNKSSIQQAAEIVGGMDTFMGSYDGESGLAFDEIGDLSLLSSCPELEFLSLGMYGLENIDFLDDLPNLYSFILSGSSDAPDSPPSVGDRDRQKLTSPDSYPHIKCLVLDGKWLRNPE